jgi:hypothetical protein
MSILCTDDEPWEDTIPNNTMLLSKNLDVQQDKFMIDDVCMLCRSHAISLETSSFHTFTQVGTLCLKLHHAMNHTKFTVLTKKGGKVQKR